MRAFPLSYNRSQPSVWDGTNPLSVLHPHEARAAEMYVLVDRDPMTAATMPAGGRRRKWGAMLSGAFGTRFQEAFGIELTSRIRKGLERNRAWIAYVQHLNQQPKDAVMELLRSDGLSAYVDYTEARAMAKAAGDYKVLGLQAADHLDRIGATEKPSEQQQQVMVVLKGRNYDEKNLMSELPEPEVEVVTVKDG